MQAMIEIKREMKALWKDRKTGKWIPDDRYVRVFKTPLVMDYIKKGYFSVKPATNPVATPKIQSKQDNSGMNKSK